MTTYWGLDLGECELAAVKVSVVEGVPELQDFALVPVPCRAGGRGPGEEREALLELVRRLHLRRAVVHAADADLCADRRSNQGTHAKTTGNCCCSPSGSGEQFRRPY